MYNLPEMTANDLTATVPETNDPYVILQSDKQPYTVKIKLCSPLKVTRSHSLKGRDSATP